MSKLTRLFAAALVLLLVVVPAAMAQNLKLDVRLNALQADSANYLIWTLGSTKTSDKFDAASGASLLGSTAALDSVRYDSEQTKKATVPVALRGIALYPVADYETLKYDDFKVSENGKSLTIRYVHRGTAYELVTDAKGKFDVLTGAKSAKGLADNVGGEFILKDEFVKSGGDPSKMSDLDWSKVKLVLDTRDPSASRWYEGSLTFAYKKGVFTGKGSLVEKK